jgi:hypothetical protein
VPLSSQWQRSDGSCAPKCSIPISFAEARSHSRLPSCPTLPQDGSTFRMRTQETTAFDLGYRLPGVDRVFHSYRNCHRPQPAAFANQVHDDLPALSGAECLQAVVWTALFGAEHSQTKEGGYSSRACPLRSIGPVRQAILSSGHSSASLELRRMRQWPLLKPSSTFST